MSNILKGQGRFRDLTESGIEKVQKLVDEDWDKYRKLASNGTSDFAPYGKMRRISKFMI